MERLDLEKYLRKFKKINVSNEIPLIKYSKDYPIPSKLEFEEYETTLKNYGKFTKIKRYRLIGLVEELNPIIKAKRFYKGDQNRRGLKYIIKDNKFS